MQKENSNLLKVIKATKGQDLTIIANLQVKDLIIVTLKVNINAIKEKAKYKTKLSENGARKRIRLN
jgi:hypothetical protein